MKVKNLMENELAVQYTPENTENIQFYDGSLVEDSLKNLAYHRAKLAEIKDHAHTEKGKIAMWEQGMSEGVKKSIGYHESVLRAQLEFSGKKSLKMVNGKVSKRAGRDRLVFVDNDGVTPDETRKRFIDWAKINQPDLVETTVVDKTNANDIMRAVKEHGEQFPYITIETGHPSFKAEVY